MKIRSHLFVLSAGAIVPLLLVLVVAAYVQVRDANQAFREEAGGRVRAAMSTIDAELRGSLTTMRALAASKNLATGDVRAFHAEAQRVLAAQPEWLNIGLTTVGREQLMDAIRPYGQQAHYAGDDESFLLALTTGKPAIGDIRYDGAIGTSAVHIRMPVVQNGSVRYVLSVPIKASAFRSILDSQKLPEGWVIALADRERRLIARIPQVPVGTSVSDSYKAALERAPSGWFAGNTLEGAATYTPYITSAFSGWTLGIAIPAAQYEAGAWRALWIAVSGVLLALAAALLLAGLIARRIAAPIAALARVAPDISGASAAELRATRRIDEVSRLYDALSTAHRAVRERETQLTERTVEAETLMQVLPIPVLECHDSSGARITANAAGYRFFNVKAGGNLSLCPPPDATLPGFRMFRDGRELAPSELPMQQAIHGAEVRGEEFEYRFEDGSVKYGYVCAAPLFDLRGEVRGAISAVLDISERKDQERRKDEFVATLAHELRNPLAAVVNALRVLTFAEQEPAAGKKAREILERQVGQIKRLVDDLMDISRISRGKISLRREDFPLATVVQQAVDACMPALRAMEHALEVHLPPLPVTLHADPLRVAQIIINLLGNACKFTARGGKIRLTAASSGRDLVICVKDNGLGIAPEVLPRIFDMFAQADHTPHQAQTGLGIGLTLVKRLAELHGGSVEAYSAGTGKGAEFIIRLPIVVDRRQVEKAPVVTQEHASVSTVSPKRVLVVDDNEDAAESLCVLLGQSGHTTRVAHDGLEALQVAVSFKPHVVLMDLGMPKLDGYEAARRMRALPEGKEITLIALSGWGQERDRLRSREAGFNDHLVKPVDIDALVKLLDAARSVDNGATSEVRQASAA